MRIYDSLLELDDKSLFVRTWRPASKRDDIPIILFHDSLGAVDLWRDFPAALSDATQRTVIAYDRFGYGKSSANPNQQPFDFVSQEAEIYFPALREQLQVDQFILFGHSVGGGMAVHVAAKFPNLCQALITESAQAFVEDRTVAGIRDAQVIFADASNVARLARYHGDKAQWVLDAWIETWLAPEFSDWTLKPILPQVTCPVLAIHGSDDEYGSVAHPKIITDFAGGQATMKILDGLKHVPHREQGQTVIDLVVDFLA